MKGFTKKASMIFLVIKDEVGSVDSFVADPQERHLVFSIKTRRGRGIKFEVDEVKVGSVWV